jgi:hypothetical protein
MADRIELARRVFEAFQHYYGQITRPGANWSLSAENFPRLSDEERDIGISFLMQKRLIRTMGIGAWTLTDDGKEACLHPELLDEYLGPRRNAALVAQEINISADQIHGSQIGGTGNVMNNITIAQALTTIATRIEADTSIPPEKRKTWAESLRAIALDGVAGVSLAEALKSLFS